MKISFALFVIVLILGHFCSAQAIISIENVSPPDGSIVVPDGPLDIYIQIFAAGVTDNPGQGPSISGFLQYYTDIAPPSGVTLEYFQDVGDNDEYVGQIPQQDLIGASSIQFIAEFEDHLDGSFATSGAVYDIGNDLPNDVEVEFRMCLGSSYSMGDVCISGWDSVLTNWGDGIEMNSEGGIHYTLNVVFPAGSNPNVRYRYKKDDCATGENGNRLVVLPTDGSTYFPIPNHDIWDHATSGCDFDEVLSEAKTICFQLCIPEDDSPGGVCLFGTVPEMGSWDTGIGMDQIASNLYQTCIEWPVGTYVPLTLSYRFKKNDCSNIELISNREYVLDNEVISNSTLTHVWEDGPGACDPVATEPETWGRLKSLYR